MNCIVKNLLWSISSEQVCHVLIDPKDSSKDTIEYHGPFISLYGLIKNYEVTGIYPSKYFTNHSYLPCLGLRLKEV